MPVLMGFAAGAMIYLVLLELIPQALEDVSPPKLAWAFTIGFCGMILVQVLL
jgi:ZIP family zinc transporter